MAVSRDLDFLVVASLLGYGYQDFDTHLALDSSINAADHSASSAMEVAARIFCLASLVIDVTSTRMLHMIKAS